MRNAIVSEYEKKRWYRVAKLIYIVSFAIVFIMTNLIVSSNSSGLLPLVIASIVVIFFFGIIEGSFWYIVRGKWGYPKEEK